MSHKATCGRLRAFAAALVKANLCEDVEDDLLSFVRGRLGIDTADVAAWPVHAIAPRCRPPSHSRPNGARWRSVAEY
jgi:hypothetical protein